MHLLGETGELCVCDLATVLEMTPAAVSQHLSRLRSGRMVGSRRDGMTIYYRLTETVDPEFLVSIFRGPGGAGGVDHATLFSPSVRVMCLWLRLRW